jgi:hypothetical protein
VYALDEAGADLVAIHLGVDRAQVGWKPKHNQLGLQFLDHGLAINDVRLVIQQLVDQAMLVLVEWLDEFTLKSAEWREKVPQTRTKARVVRKYPDGYFTLQLPHNKQPAHFFLEIDQATMTNARWQEKVRAYSTFRQSGQSQKYYGTRNFRVLTVTTSERRLTNLKRATEQAKGDHFFWFTTQEQVTIWEPETILEAVWWVATKEEREGLFSGSGGI